MFTLRTKETEERYKDFIAQGNLDKGCNLCNAPAIKEFKYWKITDNLFPWDYIAKTQHMIIPKRHTVYGELTPEEKQEFDEIKINYIDDRYDISAESTTKKKSIPGHFHIHLVILKD